MKHRIIITIGLPLLVGQACDSEEFVSAKMYLQNNDYEHAKEYFIKAMDVEPTNANIPLMLARDVYARQRNWSAMGAALAEALKRNPEQMVAGYSIEELVLNVKQVNWSDAYQKGASLYNEVLTSTDGVALDEQKASALQQAAGYLKAAIEIYPEEPAAYQPLISVYRQLNDKAGERNTIDDALMRDPKNGMVLMMAGQNAYADSNFAEALEYLERASVEIPDNLELLQFMTGLYLDLDNTAAALVTLERARSSAPRNSDVFYNIGAIYTNVANDALIRGQDIYREAVMKDPPPIEDIQKALQHFKDAQIAYSEGLYFMDNVLALTPDDEAADNAIREIQSRKKSLDALQRATEGLLD